MNRLRTTLLYACLVLAAGVSRADDSQIRSLFDSGSFEEARQAIARILAPTGAGATDPERAQALRWLGRIEVAAEDWAAALAAYERLTSEFAETDVARDAATEVALLEALTAGSALGNSPGDRSETAPADETALPKPSLTPAPAPSSVGGVLVGTYGVPFNAAEEAGLLLEEYLGSKGIETGFEATPSQALRGRDAVAAHLLARARELGRPTLILVRSRWGFREFVEVECYTSAGVLLWQEKVPGGRGPRDEKVKKSLMERLFKKVAPHIGEQGLEAAVADQ